MKFFSQSIALALFLSFSFETQAQIKEDRPQAEQTLKDGIKAYKDGRFEDALSMYQKAAGLAPTASGPYREMGKVYEALGREEDARFAYQEYLRRNPNASDAADIQSRISAIASRNPSKGSLFLPSTVAGIEVWIDGKQSATTPMVSPLALPSGSYEVELKQGATIISKETVSISSGEAKVLSSPEVLADTFQTAPKNKKRSPWVWVAGSAALVGVGIGTAIAIDALESGKDEDKDNDKSNREKRRTTPLTFTFSF